MIHFKLSKINYKLITIITIIILFLSCILIFYNVKAKQTTEISVPIIMYHSILKSKSGKYIVNPTTLEDDLKFIKNNGYTTITITDLINYVYSDSELPEKPIIITFDDGHYNNLTYALPLLEKYDMVAVISIVGKYTDTYTKSNEANPNYGYLRWKDINDLMKSGRFEFQNHTYELHNITKNRRGCMKMKDESFEAYKTVLSKDLSKLQQEFNINTGYIPNTFTYPFGAISSDSIDIIKELGFKASLSCNEGINLISKDPNCLYELKRYNRPNNISTDSFFKKIK
ncbi:MAG: polysaccharide deacetylase family protein [Clostridia bacterium]|nr:polysaccharide deacetylase family protein [Clostridia bacterium]